MRSKQYVGYIETVLRKIYPQDTEARDAATRRLEQLTMPHWALGRFMDLAVDLAGMTASVSPRTKNKTIVVMAGDHGVAAEGVSGYPPEVTTQMVHNIMEGGAGINALAAQAGARVVVADMGVVETFPMYREHPDFISKKIGKGTDNIKVGPAMTRSHAVMTVEAGIRIAEMLAPETDVFGTGEMGIANTTPSSAVAAVLTGQDPAVLTGRGTGIDDKRMQHKIEVVERALKVNKPDSRDGFDVLAKVGGFEIGGIAGLIIGAAAHRKPVVVDGFISTAGALIACTIEPFVRDYIICAHRSVEPGHGAMMEKMQLSPLFELDFRLGEGTGAAFAMNAVAASAALLTEVRTFSEAGVSASNENEIE